MFSLRTAGVMRPINDLMPLLSPIIPYPSPVHKSFVDCLEIVVSRYEQAHF